MLPKYTFLFVLTLLCYTSITNAADYFFSESIQFDNQAPILSLFSYSTPEIIKPKTVKSISFKQQLSISNYISSTSKESEQFLMDGETWEIKNILRYQFSPEILVSTSIPWIKHHGGIADSFIYNFHDLFQLPQNGRTKENENELRWILNKDGENILNQSSKQEALGDVDITVQLTPSNTPSIYWSWLIKLPTGNYDAQTGSEKFETGFSFTQLNPDWFRNRTVLPNINLAFWYGFGASYIGKVNALSALNQNRYLLTYRSGLAYAPKDKWHIKCQLDTHSPLFDSEIRELGWHPIQISFSSWHQISDSTTLEFVILEDIRPRTTPDVIFQTSYEVTF